jgi:translation initiation factor IF-1
MCRYNIKCAAGDVVGIVLDSYDQTRGRIIYRYREAS